MNKNFQIVFFIISLLFVLFAFSGFDRNTSSSGEDSAALKSGKILTDNIQKRHISKCDYSNLALYFIKNLGQKDPRVFYYANTQDYVLWVTRDGLVFDTVFKNSCKSGSQDAKEEPSPEITRSVSKIVFLKPNEDVRITAIDRTAYTINYFSGNDPSKWKKDIPSFEKVLYEGVYKDINLYVYGRQTRIEYDWVIKPGGRVEDIQFKYEGVDSCEISTSGDLVVKTRFGELLHKRSEGYQRIGGKRVKVTVSFQEISRGVFGFDVGEYDPRYELIIDPLIITYSTYIGGSDFDISLAVTVDNLGCAYVTGYTSSWDFPIEEPYQWWQRYNEVFVTKFSSSGRALVYSTYIGGTAEDRAYGIDVDRTGYVYITGTTRSPNFPVINAYDSSYNGNVDCFVSKLSRDGGSLEYSTFIGSPESEYANGITVDDLGFAYIMGTAYSGNFPTINAYDSTFNGGGRDIFLTKLSQGGDSLVYSTFLGTASPDEGYGIKVDSSGCAYITGRVNGSGLPVLSAYQSSWAGSWDAFVTKFSPSGGALVYSTYLGGAGGDFAYSIAIDNSGSAYITGETGSDNFPLKNPLQVSRNGNNDIFIAILSSAGNSLVFSTYFGGSGEDYGKNIAVDGNGESYITGVTRSNDFPVYDATQPNAGGGLNDAFLINLLPSGSGLRCSTYLGGSSDDFGFGLAIGPRSTVFVSGGTYSSDFPVFKPYDGTINGSEDAFLVKYQWYVSNVPPVAIISASPVSGKAPLTVDFDGSGSYDFDGTIVSYDWNFGDGNTASGEKVTNIYLNNGIFTATLTVTDDSGDSAVDTVVIRTIENEPPVAVIRANPIAGLAPLDVEFYGGDSYDRDGQIVSYKWYFSNGLSVKGERAHCTFIKPGIYTAYLLVQDDSGNQGQASVTISVYDLALINCMIDIDDDLPVKAYGRGKVRISVLLIDYLLGYPTIINAKLPLSFATTSGKLVDDLMFDSSLSRYSQTLISGPPGEAIVTVILSGRAMCQEKVRFFWIKPPVELRISVKENRSLFNVEYIAVLKWTANPDEVFQPVLYRIYRSDDENDFIKVGEVSSNNLSWIDSHLKKSKKYTYMVTTVDNEGDESDFSSPIEIEL